LDQAPWYKAWQNFIMAGICAEPWRWQFRQPLQPKPEVLTDWRRPARGSHRKSSAFVSCGVLATYSSYRCYLKFRCGSSKHGVIRRAGRVLVTGGCGYIGSHTVLELLRADYEVLVLDNLCRSDRNSLDRVVKLAEQKLPDSGCTLTFREVNLCDKELLDQTFKNMEAFEAVIHFAGYKSVGESMKQPLMYWENNVGGFVNLMHVLKKYGLAKRVLLSSSCTVYKPSSERIKESFMLEPTCPYGYTKLAQERILMDIIEHGSNGDEWSGCALRYFNPAGAHPSGLLGEAPKQSAPCMLVPIVGEVALGVRDRIQIFGTDYATRDGTPMRDFLHIQDLSEAHVAALKHLQQQQGFDTFNLGTGHGSTVLEVVSAFEDVCGHQLPYTFDVKRHGDAPFAVADPSKAQAVLGWCAQRSLKEILASHWRFVKNQEEKPGRIMPDKA